MTSTTPLQVNTITSLRSAFTAAFGQVLGRRRWRVACAAAARSVLAAAQRASRQRCSPARAAHPRSRRPSSCSWLRPAGSRFSAAAGRGVGALSAQRHSAAARGVRMHKSPGGASHLLTDRPLVPACPASAALQRHKHPPTHTRSRCAARRTSAFCSSAWRLSTLSSPPSMEKPPTAWATPTGVSVPLATWAPVAARRRRGAWAPARVALQQPRACLRPPRRHALRPASCARAPAAAP